MAVMAAADVEVDRPVAVKERLEAFGAGVLADAMNRPAQMVNGRFYEPSAVSGGHVGSGGQRPPRLSIASAMRAAGLRNP